MNIFKKLSHKYDNLYLIIVGNGPLADRLLKDIVRLGLENKINLLGACSQNQINELYTLADYFILPSQYEIFGMVILESMYHGTPVITSPTAGALQVIEHGVDGYLIRDWNIDTWCDQISELIENPSKRESMSKNCVEKIKNNYLWSQVVKNYIAVYEDVLHKDSTAFTSRNN